MNETPIVNYDEYSLNKSRQGERGFKTTTEPFRFGVKTERERINVLKFNLKLFL
jgi:hypothetical protein